MPVIYEPLLPVRIKFICESCGKGEMQRVQGKLHSVDDGFIHQCNFCKTEQLLPRIYPTIDYVNFYQFIQDASTSLKKHEQSG